MNDNQFDDFLRQQLRNSSDYLDDGDFSAQVMASLPAPKRLNPWLERLIIWFPVTFIALLVLKQFPLHSIIQPAYAWLLTLDLHSLIALAMGMTLAVLAIPLSLLLKRSSLM